MAEKQGCGSQLLGAVVLLGLIGWGINSCVERDQEARRAEEQRRASLTPEQRAEEDRIKAEQAAKAAAEQERESRELEVQRVSEDYVRKFLKFPDDADFGFWSIPHVKSNQTGDTFYVESKVKAKNAFGAQLTYRWQTIVFLDNGTWRLVSCAIDDKLVYESKELLEKIKERKAPSAKVQDLGGAIETTRNAQVNFNHRFSNERLDFTLEVYSVQDHRRNGEGWGVVGNPVDPSDNSVVLSCSFDDKGAAGIGKAKKGDRVKIRGTLKTGSRDDKGNVILSFEECELR